MLFHIWPVSFAIRSGRAFLVQFCRKLFASIRVRADWFPMVDEVCTDRPVIRIECVSVIRRKIGDKTVVCLFVRARMAACCDPIGKGWFIVGAFVSVVASGALAVVVLVGLAVGILVRVRLVLVGLGVAVGILGVLGVVVVCGVFFLVGLVRCRLIGLGLVGLGLVAAARRIVGVIGLAIGGVVLRLGVTIVTFDRVLVGLVRVSLALVGLGVGVVVCGVVFLVGLIRRGLICLGLVSLGLVAVVP